MKEDVKEAIKIIKTFQEIERKLSTNYVSYRIMDETKEGKKQHTDQITKASF